MTEDIARNLTLVIPAYNEELRIERTLKSLLDNISSLKEIILVVDGTDSTADVASKFSPRVRILRFDERIGKGNAIIEGLKKSTTEITGYVDADYSVPWNEVSRLVSHVSQETPVVIGSRWTSESTVRVKQPLKRLILSRAYRYFVSFVLGMHLKDYQCGAKFFHSSILNDMVNAVRVGNWGFDTALLYNIMLSGTPIEEVGIEWSDMDGSKLNVLRIVPVMFAYVIGLRLAHSKYSDALMPIMNKINRGYSLDRNAD